MSTLNKVENLLQNGYKTASPQVMRDSDKALLMAMWELEGFVLSNEQKRAFMHCTTAETITRARRALKSDYPASKAVDDARYEKFKQYKYDRAELL